MAVGSRGGIGRGGRSRQKANLCVSAGSRKKSRNIQRADPRFAHISQSNCRHVGVSHAQCYVTHPEMHSALTASCEEPTYRDLTKMLRRCLHRPCFPKELDARKSETGYCSVPVRFGFASLHALVARLCGLITVSCELQHSEHTVQNHEQVELCDGWSSCSVDRNLGRRWLTLGSAEGWFSAKLLVALSLALQPRTI
jgi:hypothetical protein